MKHLFSQFVRTTLSVFVLALILVGVQYTFAAWSDPTQAPPGGNVPSPVNIGPVDQVKSAGLSLDALSVFGQVLIKDGTEGEGRILTSDANGVARWEEVANNSSAINLECVDFYAFSTNNSADMSDIEPMVGYDKAELLTVINGESASPSVNPGPHSHTGYRAINGWKMMSCSSGDSPAGLWKNGCGEATVNFGRDYSGVLCKLSI